MSNLLEQASLVLIPSGYKEDVVYSQIPLDGSGDMNFTRSSNGTRVNSAGLVEVCPWNLAQYSEQFDNGVWQVTSGGTGSNPGITANDATAPNGTTTADKIVFNTGAGTSGGDQSIIYQNSASQPEGVYTFSVYAKVASGTAKILVRHAAGGTYTTLNLTTEWQRFEIVETNPITQVITMQLGLRRGLVNEPISSPVTCYLWGAQLNIGSTAKPYFPTTDRLNVPRLTYQNGGGGCPSLLLEKQSTNLCLWSEDFTQSDWTKAGVTISANATTSPDGTTNADKLVSINATSSCAIAQSINITNGAIYTYSAYVKKAGADWVQLIIVGGPIARIWVNLTNGAIGTNNGNFSSVSVDSMGNDWYRIKAVYTTATSSSVSAYIVLANGDNIDGFTGNGTSGVFAYGAQLEQSSYATSLINTTSASATRVADFATTNNISSLFGSTEGSFFIEMTYDNTNASGAIPLFLRSSTNAAYNYATYLQFGGGTVQFYVYDSGSSQVSITSSAIYTTGQKLKIAFAYKQNDFVIYVNGVQIGTDANGTISTSLAFIDLGTYNQVADTYRYNGAIGEAVLFPTRLTNTQLAQLTA